MSRRTKYDAASRNMWVELRLAGWKIKKIAAYTNANEGTVSAYLQELRLTRSGNYHNADPDPPEDTLVWVDGYQLPPDAALRFRRLKAALGIAGCQLPVGEETLEQEWQRGGYLTNQNWSYSSDENEKENK